MPDYDPTFFGRHWAEVYDAFFPQPDEKDCIECLAALAGRGPILELGIGSGRVALPLARRNVEVHGIEASPEMVTKLRAKPGGNDLLVHIGDFVDVAVQGEYPLILAIFNTLLCVTSQNDQVRCLVNVAQHLSADGILVIEAGLPMSESGRGIQVHELRADRVTLLVHQLDHVTQQLAQQTILIANGMIRLIPDRYRFIWPSELDLMANIAGLRLRERWGDWRRGPFTSSSAKHISVYESARR
jgi:SAM-dependent methyltransferase